MQAEISRQSGDGYDKIRKISAHRAAIILHQTVENVKKEGSHLLKDISEIVR